MGVFNLDLNIDPVMPKRNDFKIGVIGAGAIVRDCHLVSYRNAGLEVYGITSKTGAGAKLAAKEFNIPNIYDSWQELIEDENIEILDIAVPPDRQLEIVREAAKKKHIKGILCQKPLAMNIGEAVQIVEICEEANIKLGVNSNMRYDQSMRALKTLLDNDYFGEVVLATIEMRAIPHWQEFLKEYDRIEILNMGIHHVDVFRYLFGDPEKITALTRKDPRTKFNHIDGISQYTFQYENDLMATSLDDVWAWQGEGTNKDMYIKWRVEGLDGMAWGTIGWPASPNWEPSTLKFTSRKHPNLWIEPTWDKVWFPDAFLGTMTQLLRAVEEDKEPEIGGRDNLHTMAAIEACYRSIEEEKTIKFAEILKEVYE